MSEPYATTGAGNSAPVNVASLIESVRKFQAEHPPLPPHPPVCVSHEALKYLADRFAPVVGEISSPAVSRLYGIPIKISDHLPYMDSSGQSVHVVILPIPGDQS